MNEISTRRVGIVALVIFAFGIILAGQSTAVFGAVDTWRADGWNIMRYTNQSVGAGRVLVDRTPRLTRTDLYVDNLANRTCTARIAMVKGPKVTIWKITVRPAAKPYYQQSKLPRSHGTRDRTIKVHIKSNGNCFVGAAVR